MFGWSKESFKLEVSHSTSAKTKIAEKEPLIKDLVDQQLKPLFAQLRERESFYQRKLLIELRECLGYTQKKLAEVFKKTFPNSVMSQSTLCRTERGERAVTNELWERMAKLLGVDKANFFPLVTPLN
jgi:DNA-binding XRE family transcriptional regulator